MIIAEIDNLEADDARIVLHGTAWSQQGLVKRIPGKRWDRANKYWTLPLAWSSCVVARSIFGDDLKVGTHLGAWARGKRDAREAALYLRDKTTNDHLDYSGFVTGHEESLYPYQTVGRDFLVTARNAILGDEMGTGKTFQTLAAIRAAAHMRGDDNAYPALVVCPNTLKRTWAKEIRKWLPEATPIVIDGSAKKRREQLASVDHVTRPIVIMNIESTRLHTRLSAYGSIRLKRCTECDPKEGTPELSSAKCEVHPKELNAIPFKICVLDEAHRVKDPRALQTRGIWSTFHGPTVRYRWALTGTPVANHPGDLWSILHTIDPVEFSAKSAFIDRYALTEFNAFGGMSIMGLNPGTKDEFFGLIDPMFRRMVKTEVLRQLPPKVFEMRTVPMSRVQAKLYAEMASQYRITVDTSASDTLVADGNLAAATRLLQLASASVHVDRGETPDDPASWTVTLDDPSSKIDELMRIIEDDPSKPLVIAAEHRQLIDLAAARMEAAGLRFGRVTGGQTAQQRAETVEAFQAGRLDYVLFTYKAGGVGITLTRADTMVRLQRSWSLVDNLQGEDRCHRVGSEIHDVVTIIDLVAEGTIEEDQLVALQAKAGRLEEVVRDRERVSA